MDHTGNNIRNDNPECQSSLRHDATAVLGRQSLEAQSWKTPRGRDRDGVGPDVMYDLTLTQLIPWRDSVGICARLIAIWLLVVLVVSRGHVQGQVERGTGQTGRVARRDCVTEDDEKEGENGW